MKNIHLNIIGIKNFESDDLDMLLRELKAVEIHYSSVLYDPFDNLKRKIRSELGKRDRRKWVWVEFMSEWSGYRSEQRRMVGRFYRKLDKMVAEKLPTYFEHQFTDNTFNGWNVKIVDLKGKDEGSYSSQVDEFLKANI